MKILRDIWAILLPAERRRAFLVLGVLLVGTLVEMVSIGLVVPVLVMMTTGATSLPAVIRDRLALIGAIDSFRVMLVLMLGLVVVFGLKSLFLLCASWCQALYVRSVQASVSRRLFATVLAQPWTFHMPRNSAALVHVLEESSAFSQACTHLLSIGAEVFVGIGLLALLLWIEPVGALVVAGMLVVAIWALNRLVRRRSRRWAEASQDHARLLRKEVHESLAGIKEVKLHGCERECVDTFRLHSEAMARTMTLQWLVEQAPRPWFEMLSVTTLLLLTVAMAWQGKPVRSLLPVLGLYATVAFRMLPSINQGTIAAQRLRRSEPMINALRDHLALARSLPPPEPRTLVGFCDAIRLERVSYRYPQRDRDVLVDIDLRIPCGAAVGFVGTSGAGKSTLVDVILGLLPPTSGRVTVDGFDIRENVRGWQDIVGYVPQAIHLVDHSIRRNVAFGVPENVIDDAAVRRALASARLDEFVRSLPNGIETVVGERGVRLSGGQRQRLAIARALYFDPLVLVLDEATSALDAETEREVMEAVEQLHGMKTIIIVAHRLGTVADCDVLYRLEAGRIVGSGPFAEMVSADAPETSPG